MPTTSDYTEGHTVRAFDAEMESLRSLILQSGGLVVDQIAKAVAALTEHDSSAADLVIEREEEINRSDLTGEEMVFGLLAKRQPVGADLRAIIAMSKTLTDIERCGDEAKKIAKIARRLTLDEVSRVPEFNEVVNRMAKLAQRLLKQVLETLDNADAKQAVNVAEADARLDSEYKLALRIIHERLVESPNRIDHAADLVIAIKALERVGDHAKNIARYVIFLVEGKDVRHVKTKKLGQEISGPQ